ncbi:VWA domain-containing protein [Candidatus Woesearchaeota archaeon]|nr:VWA domain-containing protein [Candidatus Woesearchaeota archaeon]
MIPNLSLRLCEFGYCLMYSYAILFVAPLIPFFLFVIYKNFIKFKSDLEREEFMRNRRGIRLFLLYSRMLIFIFLLIALATPFAERVTTLPGNPSLKILMDNSSSFGIFEANIDELKAKLGDKIPVSLVHIASGESSKIGDAIIHNSVGDDNLLLVTDGNNNEGRSLGDVILFASTLNTSINMLDVKPVKSDVGIKVLGPKEVIVGTENEFIVRVFNVGEELNYHIEVIVDNDIIIGQEAQGPKDFSFPQTFSREGHHKITAKLTGVDERDYFEQNNVFYKAVKVILRPHLLYVTQKDSPLLSILDTIYDVDIESAVPSNLDYDAVIVDDLPNEYLAHRTELLSDYISEKGNGFLVVGGLNAYDRGAYKGSLFETLLPVNIGQAEIEEKESANVVIVIDISESTGHTVGRGDIDFEKSLAVGMLDDFRPDDLVGVVAFNHLAYMVSPLTRLGEKRDVSSRILSLRDVGGTVVLAGLQKADVMLSQARGSKYIVLISDGMTQLKEEALEYADSLRRRGIRIYSVGVGGKMNKEFMMNLAAAGNGIYFEPDESQHLRLLFGSSAEPLDEDLSLVIFDSAHFITRGVELRGQVSGLNFVVPKTAGRRIVTTNEGYPIVSIWRYGLGRVASLSTDSGEKWGGELLSANNFKLIGRLVNWVVGDLSRNKRYDVTIDDISLGEKINIVVVSDDFPQAEGLSFAKVDANLYVATTETNETGFYEYDNAVGAVNYKSEYEKLGLNQELVDVVTASGGHIFGPNDAENIANTIKTVSKRKKLDFITYRWPFTSAAMFVFLLEVFVRRLRENKYMRR